MFLKISGDEQLPGCPPLIVGLGPVTPDSTVINNRREQLVVRYTTFKVNRDILCQSVAFN